MSTSLSTEPLPKTVLLDPGDLTYIRLLGGPPETRSIKAGLVTLSPGKSIGLHSTEANEEVIVPLAGCGELRIANHVSIALATNAIAYVPPQTEHDVINTGAANLKYIFIIASAD